VAKRRKRLPFKDKDPALFESNRALWKAALRKMPFKTSRETGWSMLAKLLQMKNAMAVYHYYYEGKLLMDDNKRHHLQLLAGPYSKVIAKLLMKKYGIDSTKLKWRRE